MAEGACAAQLLPCGTAGVKSSYAAAAASDKLI